MSALGVIVRRHYNIQVAALQFHGVSAVGGCGLWSMWVMGFQGARVIEMLCMAGSWVM